mgnify:FL=1
MADDPDRRRGLYGKYRVARLNDPARKHGSCAYYVLDLQHDRFAAQALSAYAVACEAEYPLLADDLRTLIAVIPRERGEGR